VRHSFDHGVVYGAGDGQWRCLARYGNGVECARASGGEGKDESVLASGVLRRPVLCQGALTACAGMPWRGAGRACSGQMRVSLCVGLVQACLGEYIDAR
jgi:hypothetical protein